MKETYHELEVHECAFQETWSTRIANFLSDRSLLVDTNNLDILQVLIKDIAQEGAANAT